MDTTHDAMHCIDLMVKDTRKMNKVKNTLKLSQTFMRSVYYHHYHSSGREYNWSIFALIYTKLQTTIVRNVLSLHLFENSVRAL